MARIPASHTTAADLYARTADVSRLQAQQATRPQALRPAATAEPTAATDGLTAAERETIDRYFPEKPALTLRLYGPGRGTQTIQPDAVGHRLDLRA